jgi:hypothetical protein
MRRYTSRPGWKAGLVTESLDSLLWVDSVEAVTLSVASGFDVEPRVRLIFGDPTAESHDTFSEAEAKGWMDTPNTVPVQFDTCPGGDVLIEPNGFLTSNFAAVLTRKGGTLASIYWNDAIGKESVTFARDGRIVRYFEFCDPASGEGDPQPEEAGLPWALLRHPSMLALFERVALFPVTEDWLLRTPRRTWLVLEPHAAIPDDL